MESNNYNSPSGRESNVSTIDIHRKESLDTKWGHVNPALAWESEGQHDEGDGGTQEPSPAHADATRVYPQRWYILAIFALLACMQALAWNTWGPLSDSAGRVYGWTNDDIALLSNWGPIAFLLSTAFFAWLLDVRGLRAAALVAGGVVAGGAGFRCITSSQPAAMWLIHTGQFLNGLGGPVAMGAGTLLSSNWFPASQRTTATALITTMNYFGVALSFLIGPLTVPDRGNSTSITNTSGIDLYSDLSQEDAKTQSDIMTLLYIEFGVASMAFLLLLIYFPSKPKVPPSITASVERVNFKHGLMKLLRHGPFWLLAVPYAISGGIFAGWSAVLHVNLKQLGISEIEAGWLGFYMTLAGNVSCLIIARFADMFKKRMKLYLVTMFSIAFVVFATFTLAAAGFIPFSNELMYTCLILVASCINGVVPLFYELCCEMTYPIAEGVTNTFLTWIFNVAMMSLLLIMMIPNIGTSWLNWSLLGGVGICIPILLVVNERYTRLDIDTQPGPVGKAVTEYECTRF